MASKKITKKPNKAVKSVSTPERESGGSYKMSVNIKLGAALVDTDSASRATNLHYGWSLITSDPRAAFSVVGDMAISSSTRSITKSKSITSFTGVSRSSFYPYTNVRLSGVSFSCTPYNKVGNGKTVVKTREFKGPEKPTLSDFEVDSDTGEVSCTITSDAGEGYKERVRTRYKVTIKNTLTGDTYAYQDSYFTGTSKTVTFDASQYQELAYGDYISITVQAWNQGFVGDSKSVSKTY